MKRASTLPVPYWKNLLGHFRRMLLRRELGRRSQHQRRRPTGIFEMRIAGPERAQHPTIATRKLTPAEMRVLMMIIEVGGVPKIAPVLGVSERTVKTHLTHVFEKMGSRRQVDLVKLVAGYMNPLALGLPGAPFGERRHPGRRRTKSIQRDLHHT